MYVGLVDAMMVRWLESKVACSSGAEPERRGTQGQGPRYAKFPTKFPTLLALRSPGAFGARWRHFDVPRWSAHLDPITVGLAPFFSAIEVKVLRWKL
jgi:hypothetical protein